MRRLPWARTFSLTARQQENKATITMNAPSLSAVEQGGGESRLVVQKSQKVPERQRAPLAAQHSDNQIA
jgi:hypothetical protein